MSNILEQLSQLVQQAVTQAVKAGTLPKINPDDLKIEISKPNKNFGGDYSCGVALTLTRALKRPPMQIGEAIEAAFPEAPDVVEKIWLTPPGFINFKLAHRWLTNNLKLIRDQGSSYADQDFGNQERVMIEFVSVNPTGPLHVGHARGAILGSALANILTKTGHAVWCEYYVNDAGTQNRIFQEAMYNLVHAKSRQEENKLKVIQSEPEKLSPERRREIFSLSLSIDLEPSDELHNKRGVAYMENPNPDYKRAISDFSEAIRLNPGKASAYYNRGLAHQENPNPDYEQAISDFTEAIKLDPNYTAAYNDRGNAYVNKPEPEYEKALIDYNQALQLNYKSVAVLFNRGTALARKPNPDYEQAISDFDRALALEPDNVSVYIHRGNVYKAKAKHDADVDKSISHFNKAISDYDEAIKRDPNSVLAYYNRGNAYYEHKIPDYDQARSDYTTALEKDPNYLDAYINRGIVNKLRFPDRAVLDFSKALGIDSHNTDVYEHRAEVYERLGESELARADRETVKLLSEYYRGKYMDDLKERLLKKRPDLGEISRDEFMKSTEYALVGMVVLDIKKTLDNLGIYYDQWFYESDLMGEDGAWARMFNELKQKEYIEERDGAQWFLATKFGAEKDVVVKRSDVDNLHTYFATDFAYHLNKLGPKPPYRDFSRTINIWGGDHHGHVIRLAAAMQAVDIDPARVQVQTVQIVHFKADDKKLKLSKRKGQIVTIDDLLEEVGKDACRYEFLNRSHNAQMTFDIEQAKRQSLENPVYYIQYAHARLCSILERAVVLFGWDRSAEFDLNLLKHPNERALMFHLTELPMVLRTAAERLEPHLVTFYLYDLARRFQKFYEECRVISGDKALSDARLLLVYSTKTVLNEVLRLLGISAPQRMVRNEETN